MKKVIVEITDDLKVKFDYNGFQGEECIQDFEKLMKTLRSLGVDVGDAATQKKREFYVRSGSSVRTR